MLLLFALALMVAQITEIIRAKGKGVSAAPPP